MIVDGKQIAAQIYEELKERVLLRGTHPVLTIITCAPNFETKKYLALKEKKASYVGIETNIIELDATSTTADFLSVIKKNIQNSSGIIVQLPLPQGIDADTVLRAIPTTHDVDALNPETMNVLSPVVGALREILKRHNVSIKEKFVTIIGSGKLVGLPAYKWFTTEGAFVTVVTRDTVDIKVYTQNADIIVCGAGVPGLLEPNMIKEGVIILDAGTSEEGGMLRGDASPLCAEKAQLFTPVPGGIGPMTVAILLKNVIELSQ